MPSAASKPQPDQLKDAIDQASQAHMPYESNALNGVRDERWSGWYAAYILGRVGDVCTPTDLAKWLEGPDGWGLEQECSGLGPGEAQRTQSDLSGVLHSHSGVSQ